MNRVLRALRALSVRLRRRREDAGRGEAVDAETYQSTFSEIYRRAAWTNGDPSVPLSGPGSSLDSTERIRAFLDHELARLGVRSILDVGCGDLAWLAHTRLPTSGIRYTGVDIVPELIAAHRERHPWATFLHANAVEDPLPAADLVIVRDCLIHLRLADVRRLLRNLCRQEWRHLLVSTYPAATNDDRLDRWHFHPINLEAAPFLIRRFDLAFDEPAYARRMILVPRDELERAISAFDAA